MNEILWCISGVALGVVLWHALYQFYYRKHRGTADALIARLRELRDAKEQDQEFVGFAPMYRRRVRRDLAIELLAMLGEE